MRTIVAAPGHRLRSFAVLALGLAVALMGCGGLLPNPGPLPTLYTLTPKNTFRDDLPTVTHQLVVEEPRAAGALATQSIAIRTDPVELQYFAGARWTERAPRLIQTLLVESFENTGEIVAVGREAIGLRSDYNLRSDLREFQVEYSDPDSPPLVRVRINAKLIRQPRREIVASRTFEHTAQATTTGTRAAIMAFDEALGKVLRRVVEWTLMTME